MVKYAALARNLLDVAYVLLLAIFLKPEDYGAYVTSIYTFYFSNITFSATTVDYAGGLKKNPTLVFVIHLF